MSQFIRDRLPEAVNYFGAEGLTLTGPGKWRTTRCDFHGGSDSMRVHIKSGAWICMNCGVRGGDVLSHHMQAHGLEFVEAARALGAYVDDGRPHRGQATDSKLSSRAALELLEFESLLVAVAAGNIAQGMTLTDDDRARVMQAAGRIGYIAQEMRT